MTTAKEASEGVKVAKEQASEQSLNELVQRASSQTASLVRKEIRLAQVELQEKGKRAGIGAGMLGGSGVVALYGVGTLTAAAILALATAMTGWLAALVRGGRAVRGGGCARSERQAAAAAGDTARTGGRDRERADGHRGGQAKAGRR
jgi:Putative Actinobacterial Holin-X, holin superfamily III